MSILIVFLDEFECLRLTFLAIVVCKSQVLISLESTFSKQFGERTKKKSYVVPSGLKVGCLFLLTKNKSWFAPQGH